METLYYIHDDQVIKTEGSRNTEVGDGKYYTCHDLIGPFIIQLGKDAFFCEDEATSKLIINLIDRRDAIGHKIDMLRRRLESIEQRKGL
ncbi:MAG TPA: hypothetical protein VEP90_24850 [Methylomirabilota bacterium]|nr:hypothetical protein [Methylomirabilota bacterium]